MPFDGLPPSRRAPLPPRREEPERPFSSRDRVVAVTLALGLGGLALAQCRLLLLVMLGGAHG